MINFLFGDFLTRLNNAKRLRSKSINVANTKLNLKTLILLKRIGIIRGLYFIDNNKLEVMLKYVNNRVVFRKLELVSVPSRKVYVDLIKLKKLKDKNNAYIFVVSTNKGLKTDFECLLNKLSGELLFRIEL
jgi:ribosomal protein S8